MSLNHIIAPLSAPDSGLDVEFKTVKLDADSKQLVVGTAARSITIPDIGSDAEVLLAPSGGTATFGKSPVTLATSGSSMRTDGMLAYRAKPRVILNDPFSIAVLNINSWVVVNDQIDRTGFTTNTQTVTTPGGSLLVSGLTGAGAVTWTGKGVQSVKQFSSTFDYDFQVDMMLNYVGLNQGSCTIEFLNTDNTRLLTPAQYASNEGLQRGIWNTTQIHRAIAINCVLPATGPTTSAVWNTIRVEKRSNYANVYINNAFSHSMDFSVCNGGASPFFYVRLMGYARTATDVASMQFRDFSCAVRPVVQPIRTLYPTPLLAGSGAGFDSAFVKDGELIKVGTQYYLYYSGYNGAVFRSGVVGLGSNLAAPVVGARVQLNVNGAVDNGAPSVYWDGTDMWLYLQNNAGPGASIQVLKSTTPGSFVDFTLVGGGIAVAGGGTGAQLWLNGVYDPCIMRQPVGGLYYLYFTATTTPYNLLGLVRTQGLALSASLAGPWVVVGQIKSNIPTDRTFDNGGCEAVNVIYNPTTATFHMQLTGGRLGTQELLLQLHSWDGLTFYPSYDTTMMGPGDLVDNILATGSGCWMIDGTTLWVAYQAQVFAGGSYKIMYYQVPLDDQIQRALVL